MRCASDGKTNTLCLISIGTPEGCTYGIPDEYQPVTLHKELIATNVFAKVKKTITKRNQYRKVWINLTENIAKVYLDEEENLQFRDYLLEEITSKTMAQPTQSDSDDTLKKLLEKLLTEKSAKSEVENLGKIAKDFVIEKFDEKNLNAYQWIQEFEKECERCTITEDRKKIEILKFFLEKASTDWYRCMILKFTVESEWSKWKKNFTETFANKGWSPIRYAFSFKYQAGSLLDYALKKEKLLLEIRKSIDTDTLIDLIAVGLPNYVSDKINRETLNGTEDLYNEIGRLEHLVYSKVEKKQKPHFDKRSKKLEEKIPCQICENENKGKRYHPESTCWFRQKNEKDKKKLIQNVNNSELEVELNKDISKN